MRTEFEVRRQEPERIRGGHRANHPTLFPDRCQARAGFSSEFSIDAFGIGFIADRFTNWCLGHSPDPFPCIPGGKIPG